MNLTRSTRAACATALLTTFAGCAASRTHAPAREVIPRILGRQAAAWNTGDIEAFMEPYRRSPDLTFSASGRVTRGWQPVLENYQTRYPDREAMGHLTFSDLEITELADEAALVLGRWKLERTEPVGGAFTLVWRRIRGRWLIVHDHTSRDAP